MPKKRADLLHSIIVSFALISRLSSHLFSLSLFFPSVEEISSPPVRNKIVTRIASFAI